jgi:acyl carrier protein
MNSEPYLHQIISCAWADIRKKERNDECNFLHDGGDSVHGIELFMTLEESLGIPFPPIELFFEHPTVKGLAAALLLKYPEQLRGIGSSL